VPLGPGIDGAGYELEPPFSPPGSGERTEGRFQSDLVSFGSNGIEIRFAEGAWMSPGPVSLWSRLTVPVIAGEEPTGPQRAATTADFSNGVSA
ncbi:MAG TPA: hypothetical protein PLV68_21580, partial [Ilumatobacteraceae bacterium]|nr:hypothetical protein [Ilumatobacteraceae bacterium]